MKHNSITRVRQRKGFCGPATLEMLYQTYGIQISQEDIALATGQTRATIENQGLDIDQLARVVESLTPHFILLARYATTIDLIERLVNQNATPVGVEWQGSFIGKDGKLFDLGHYSVLTEIDSSTRIIRLLDPDDASAYQNGVIEISNFEQRWWEYDHVNRPGDKSARKERLSFILVEKTRGDTMSIKFDLQPAIRLLGRQDYFL